MALPLNQINTLAGLQTYARDGAVDAVKVCPGAAYGYDSALTAALQGQPFATVKAMLVTADALCHAEAYGPGGVKSGSGGASSGGTSSGGASSYPSASATDLAVKAGIGGGSGWPWWLVLGGVGLGLWLLFGKKKRKK